MKILAAKRDDGDFSNLLIKIIFPGNNIIKESGVYLVIEAS